MTKNKVMAKEHSLTIYQLCARMLEHGEGNLSALHITRRVGQQHYSRILTIKRIIAFDSIHSVENRWAVPSDIDRADLSHMLIDAKETFEILLNNDKVMVEDSLLVVFMNEDKSVLGLTYHRFDYERAIALLEIGMDYGSIIKASVER